MPEKDGWKRLRNRLATVTSVATFAASSPYVSIYGMYTNPARRTLIRRLKSANKSMKIVDTSAKLAQLRAVKQDAELLAMRQAIQLTNESLDMIAHNISSYGYEYEIEAEVSGYFRKHGALDAWKPMVGSGSNSCILHSSDNVAPIKKGDVIVVDIGAEVEHYCSDITRTFAANNSFTKRQQAVYDAVEAVHTYGINLQHVGASIRENEAKIESFMGEQLMSLGLIDQPDRKAIRHYFPHATSHYLGLNPHDAGDYQAPLEAGMVLTVEPGIYIPEENIGVRIEDDILITDTGYEILSATLPHTLA
jgi:Xaa-Pro aminopeptidase